MGKINGLLGRSLRHSFSVDIHSELGNPAYGLYELEPEQLDAFFTESDIDLLNVTIPYKKQVMGYCASLSDEAQAIGSVNTIVSTPEGLYGHNTDAYGFAYMAARANISFAGKKMLIFGSGGASVSAQYVAHGLGAQSIVVISRSGEDRYDTLADHGDAEILVNATPVGMYPSGIGRSVVDLSRFPCCEGVLDLVYNPLRTDLIMQAKELGIACEGGLPMLVAQAKASEELFRSVRKVPENDTRQSDNSLSFDGLTGESKTLRARSGFADQYADQVGAGERQSMSFDGLTGESKTCLGPSILTVQPDKEIEGILGHLLAEKENIILIGMPGCGKTRVGALIAQMTGREFVDLDEKIVEAAGLAIPKIFNQQGEEGFRALESEQAALYGRESSLIIACGGGIVKHERNYAPLHQNGRIYFIKRELSQLPREGRPLSLGADLEQLYRERLPLYERFRDVSIENSDLPQQTAEKIWKEFNEYTRYQWS